MKLLEYEAKEIFQEFGIPVPKGIVIKNAGELKGKLSEIGTTDVVVKAQIDVGGRGKAGGIIITEAKNAIETAAKLFSTPIKGVPVETILVEEKLPIIHEYYVSITIDRSRKQPMILFADAGGVDIEQAATEDQDAIRKVSVTPLLTDIPPFMIRELLRDAPKELGEIINRLYHAFCKKDALLAEINPLVSTEKGVYAADAKLITDDNALARQGITVNRDLTEREREAEIHGFSYVELDGTIGVIGNGAGLTMSTLDLIGHYNGKAANFLDVGGGADQERVTLAVKLVAGMPSVKVIVVNLLGGITRCDEVAQGIINAGIDQPVIVRLAGTNETEGKELLNKHGYRMPDTMEEAVREAVEAAQ